jgi:hypothetical protein
MCKMGCVRVFVCVVFGANKRESTTDDDGIGHTREGTMNDGSAQRK